MNGPGASDGPTASRRSLLGGVAAAAATAGCLESTRSLLTRSPRSGVSLSVKTVPAETDPAATAIGRHLVGNLETAGIDATLVPMDERELLADVLINHDFDLYVGSHPGIADPDALRPLVHSRYTLEPGWQNPFGFADIDVDRLLERQRGLDGRTRRTVVESLQERFVMTQPMTPVVVADEVRALRTDRLTVRADDLDDSLGYLSLSGVDGAAPGTVTVTRTDGRVTENLNPLSVEFRTRGTVTGLLYDPIGRRVDGTLRPWLAEDWSWSDADDGTELRVRLRDGVAWHDGRSLDAEDVAFTVRFLADTSLGEGEEPVPAPRFRGRTSLVTDVEVVDDRTCRLAFAGTHRAVAERALTVPVLPAHVWRDRSSEAELPGVNVRERTTEALIWPNPEPVGSGPLRFVERSAGRRLVLERVDDHFAVGGESETATAGQGPSDAVDVATVPFQRLVVRIVPSEAAALDLLASGAADLTSTPLPPSLVPRATRAAAVGLTATRDRAVYHVGFNVRRAPLNNPRFRRTIARLVDKDYLASWAFKEFAAPATSPLAGTDWVPRRLAWAGEDPEVPFLGEGGDLDVPAVRRAFRDRGFEYSDDGTLVAG